MSLLTLQSGAGQLQEYVKKVWLHPHCACRVGWCGWGRGRKGHVVSGWTGRELGGEMVLGANLHDIRDTSVCHWRAVCS